MTEDRQLMAISNNQELMAFNAEMIEAKLNLAKQLATANLVPKDLRNDPGSIYIIMEQSHALGIPWVTGMQEIHVIHGRISYSAQLLKALAEKDPAFEFIYVDESSDTSATVKAKRKEWDEPKEYPVTIEDARKAGYLDGRHSGLWKTRPKIMLGWMALREAARLWGSGALLGMYTDEEVEVVTVEAVDVTPEKPKKKTTKAKTKALTAAAKKDLAAMKEQEEAKEKEEAKEEEVAPEEPPSDKDPFDDVDTDEEDAVEADAKLTDEEVKEIQDHIRSLSGGVGRQRQVWGLVKVFMATHASMKPGFTSLADVTQDKKDTLWKQINKAEETVALPESGS